MRHGELRAAHGAARAVDFDVRHRCDVRADVLVLQVADTAPARDAGLRGVFPGRRARVPLRGVRRGLQHLDAARILHVLEPKLDRVDPGRRRQLVHERLVRVGVLHAARRANPRRPERRRVEPVAHAARVGERVARRGILEHVARVQDIFRRQPRERRRDQRRRFRDRRLGDPELRLPRDDGAARVDAARDLHERGWSFRIPGVLVLSRPLHAHRFPELAREQRRIGGGVLVAVATVAAGPVEVDDAHLVGRQPERDHEIAAEPMRRLRRRPHGELAVRPLGDGRRRTDGAVCVHGELVRGGELLRGAGECRFRIADVEGDLLFLDRRVADDVVELVHLGQAFPRRPRRLETLRRLHRRPLARGRDREEVADAHDLVQTLDARDAGLVDALQRRADRGRPHDARVQHAGETEVLHVRELAGDLRGDVDALHRLADQRVVGRLLERHVLVDLEVQLFVTHELRVGGAHRAIPLRADDAVPHLEVVGREAEPLGGLTDLHAADLNREAAPRRSLVGRQRGVALHEVHVAQTHVELLRRHLTERRAGARAEVDLAGVDGHVAVGADREEGVDLVERDGLGRLDGVRDGTPRTREAEADDERATALQELPARAVHDRHGYAPLVIAAAARLTARMMRGCVPQRQRLPARA